MREHRQFLERGSQYIPGDVQRAEAKAKAALQQLRDLYGDRIVEVRQGQLNELFAVNGEIGYIINVWIDLPDVTPVCLPDGCLVSY